MLERPREDRVVRIGLISDIHGNLEALEAVLRDASVVGIDALACLGDVVGYGPDPDECLELVARHCEIIIRGNHEEAAVRDEIGANFNPKARRALEATRERLGAGHIAMIRDLPDRAEIAGVRLAHANFGARKYEYLYTGESALRAFVALEAPIGAVGHTHIACAFVLGGASYGCEEAVEMIAMPPGAELEIVAGSRTILNPGSVGQPRDRNPDASWGVLDLAASTFCVRRVAYDIEAVQRKIEALGLPAYLGERLSQGV